MFNEAAITLKGMQLNSKVQAGTTKMKFTKVRIGDGVHKDDEILENSSELVNTRQEIPISHISLLEENTVKLTVIAENKEINQGFYICEMGVYVEDPDEGEILYSIATGVTGKMAYHPSCTEMVDYSLTIDVYIQVSNTKDIVIEIQKNAIASAVELEKIKEDIENLKNPVLEGTLANLIVKVNNNIKQLENPVFDDSGNVEGITNFITFMDTIKSKVSIFDFMRNLKAGLQFVVHAGKIINDSMTTEGGFVADARQLNPKLEGTLANLVAENASTIAQLNSDIDVLNTKIDNLKSSVVKITGITSADGDATIPYPDGFDKLNTILVDAVVLNRYNNNYNSFDVHYYTNNTIVCVTTNDYQFSQPFMIYLLKK